MVPWQLKITHKFRGEKARQETPTNPVGELDQGTDRPKITHKFLGEKAQRELRPTSFPDMVPWQEGFPFKERIVTMNPPVHGEPRPTGTNRERGVASGSCRLLVVDYLLLGGAGSDRREGA